MSLQTKVVGILTKPADEWREIAAGPSTVEGLIRGYVAPLAAIPAVCAWIGFSLIGISVPLFGLYRIGFVRGLVAEIVSWVFTIAAVWLDAIIIEKLAPTFQSHGGTTQAMKLVAYAMTPVWLAGVLNLVPVLSPLQLIAALYAIYLFYLGLPPVMKTPSDKVIPYMLVSAIVIILVTIVIGAVVGTLTGLSAYSTL